ncbi:toprim domain-containing protein [Kribbella sp. NBC_00709]|uniref:toprim domain-containing protein n=1 Tax=Kribbella sp. NBC_00709 TaxID=2975972 RepID=UPI002E28F5B0|nr:toprim domain-containing protein [Kribbella sp. NBC_00709]
MNGQLLEVHLAAAAFYRQQLDDRPDGWAAQHLHARGLVEVLSPSPTCWVGYAPDGWSRLVSHLRRSGYDDRLLVAAGLASVTNSGYLIDRFRDRLMFAAHDLDLHTVGFIGRAQSGRLRYLNTPTTEIYSKAKALVGLDRQVERLRAGAVPVFVEGPMDSVAVSLSGEEWVGVACCGTALSPEQALMARKYAWTGAVIVGFDGDLAGRTGALRSLEVLSDLFDEVLFARLPDRQDPAALYSVDPRQLRAVLGSARPLVDFAIEVELERWDKVLDHLSGQVNAVRAVAPLVASLPPTRVAGEIAKLAQAVHLDEQLVSTEVVAAVSRCRDRRPRSRRRPSTGVVDAGADPADYSRSP